MREDENAEDGGYRVTSLYFEDVYRSSYNDKLNGLMKRSKYRIRAYNLSPERITLEGKFKDGEYVYKKKAALSRDEYNMILAGDYSFCPENKSLRDFYARAVTQRLRPSVITDYYREAFTSEAGNVRITFDKNISAGFGLDMFKAQYSPVFGGVVLEIKYDGFIPSYIQELFSGFPLLPVPFSKFALCTDKILEVSKKCII